MDDQPIALDLTVNVRDSNCEINRLAFSVGAGEMLNAMAKTHFFIGSDAQVTNFELQWSVEVRAQSDLPASYQILKEITVHKRVS